MLMASCKQKYMASSNTRTLLFVQIRPPPTRSFNVNQVNDIWNGKKRYLESTFLFRTCCFSLQEVIGNLQRRYINTSIDKITNPEQHQFMHTLIPRTKINHNPTVPFSSSTTFTEFEPGNNSDTPTANPIAVPDSGDIDDEDLLNRNQRKTLLDAINHIVKKQKHFWTIDELKMQTQRLLEYCNDTTGGQDITPLVKKNAKMATTARSTNSPTKNHSTTTSSGTYYKYGRPSSNTFFQVLEAWMERSMMMAEQPGGGTMDCAERARLLLDAMLPKRNMFQPHTTGVVNRNRTQFIQNTKLAFLQYLLQTSHYEVVLQAYAVSNAGLPAAIRAETLLSQMIQRCKFHMKNVKAIKRTKLDVKDAMSGGNDWFRKQRHDRVPVPTLKTFNIVLNCWAKSNAYEAADRVNALLILMEQWHGTYSLYVEANNIRYHYDGCLPNERSLLCLIEAWTNGRPNEAPEVTLRILREVMLTTDHRNNAIYPIASTIDSDSLHTIKNSSIKDVKMERRYRNVQLDEAVFNAVIYAWVRSNRGRSAAVQAEDILHMMIQWSQNSSSVSTGNRVTPVQPTTRTYSMIIMAWAECETIESKGDAAQRAETILMKMVQLYSEGQDSVKPNSLLFTSCIAAWSRAAINCNEAPDRAERLWELLRKLYVEAGYDDVELEPTTQIGNAVISAWSRCVGRPDTVERALGALDILKKEGKDDLISYNTVLDAMSKKGCAQDALKMLQWLEGPESKRSLVPDLVSYNSVLAAFGRSSTTSLTQEDKDSGSKCCNAHEAETLLRRMEQMNGLKPDKLSYTCKLQIDISAIWHFMNSFGRTSHISLL